jgi:hypothetical protein
MKQLLSIQAVDENGKPEGKVMQFKATTLKAIVKKHKFWVFDGEKIMLVVPNRPENVLYIVIGKKDILPPKWAYRLSFWVHGAWDGDDQNIIIDFVTKPTAEMIEKQMKKAYKKYSDDEDGAIFNNMKNDYTLTAL